jgi:hypothetical protein
MFPPNSTVKRLDGRMNSQGASNSYTYESIPFNPPCSFNLAEYPNKIDYILPQDDVWGELMTLDFGQPASAPDFIFSFYGQNNLFSKEGETYAIIFLGSLTSAVTSWAVSMIDANLSAKKINKYNDFTNPKENKPKLSINPDIKIIPQPLSPTTQTYSPSFGLNLSLSF